MRQFGVMILKKGETKFFLQPGEKIVRPGIKNIEVLLDDEALLVRAY